MAVEIAMNTPLADALNSAMRPKLVEVGWAADGDDSPLSEYILLMLVNGKTQDEIASELAGDLLNLGPDDAGAKDFARWLFDEIEAYNRNGQAGGDMAGVTGQDADMEGVQDTGFNAPLSELNAPTGPKSMRNGDVRGNRGKRMIGQMNRAMDRTHDSVLHRVRGANGNERINAHSRQPPTGPRGAGRMGNRAMNNRANNIVHGMAAQMQGMPGVPGMPGMPAMDPNFMMANANGQGDLYALLQQQNQMMATLLQQTQNQGQGGGRGGRGGRSLFERTDRGRGGFKRGGHHGNGHHARQEDGSNGAAEGDDVDMGGERQNQNPETTVCKYNLSCTNRDCKFAHQSPAAPPGITVDVNDVCTYGVACKNFKCVAKHPSPATKRAHQGEQECKFWPNCANPRCPFKHPDMPACRNGADCKVEGCRFTHVQTKCRFNPCTNRYCQYKHDEGQRGTFQDKVWTAEGGDHVSQRQFVNSEAEEVVMPGSEAAMDEEVA
ncbi:hypothetical protein JX265_004830 [Neoarthrinium moseri]|uniref:Nab2-like CCCH zinc finger domain-containing protein n=1 Tax=Neoarthrinium moseri TaxID=1658444 RepID=A0A9P9WQ84_9PEZI|nr:hypothetical protein JX265_004830 [Neoarthrinium moseri]